MMKYYKGSLVLSILLLIVRIVCAQTVMETGGHQMPNEWIDRDTGHKIIKLTRREGINASFYFHNNPFIGDKMVFNGGRQIYWVDLNTLRIERLSHEAVPVHSEIVCARTKEIFYQIKDSVFCLNAETKEKKLIFVFPKSKNVYGINTVNCDGTLLAGVLSDPRNVEILKKYPDKSQFFNRIYEEKLKRTIFTIDIKTGKLRQVYTENAWLNHLQFSPTDPHLLMFCHEGPWQKVDRIWTVGVTGNKHPELMHKRTMDMEIAGHEWFGSKGDAIYYDLQKPRGNTFFVGKTNLINGKETAYELQRNEWSVHYTTSWGEEMLAGDGGDPNAVAKAPDGKWIYLFQITGDKLKSTKLVNMKNHNYHLEPNVHFSPDNRWIIFRANFEGQENIYAVSVKPDRDDRKRPDDFQAGSSRLSPAAPVIFLIGNSTVKNGKGRGDGGLWGWGSFFQQFFDSTRITVENHALGGRSSRTYLEEGLWDKVLPGIKRGDYLFMEFGHNDGGPLNTGTARASLKGTGEESVNVVMEKDGSRDRVFTYGHYLRTFIRQAKAKGAIPIVLSPTPRDQWQNGKMLRMTDTYTKWAEEIAEEEKVFFIDLNDIAARRYESIGEEETKKVYGDNVHTKYEGAIMNCKSLIEGIQKLKELSLNNYITKH